MRAHAFAASVLLATLASVPARAADAIDQEERAVQAWGDAHADCSEWGDGCVICRRGTEEIACSLPGIACTPGPTVCRKPAAPPATKI